MWEDDLQEGGPLTVEGEVEEKQPRKNANQDSFLLRHRRAIYAVIEFAVFFIVALVIAIFAQTFLVKAFEIPSISMEPTLKVGDRILVERISYHLHPPRRGEVIVFRFDPQDAANWTQGGNPLSRSLDLMAEVLGITHQDSVPFIKRVIGLEGEHVEVKGGEVYINGKKLEEDYRVIAGGVEGSWDVPPGHVMVMGDNRPNSNDSRRWGFVPYQSIIGRAVFIWWPPNRWGSIR
jgi:signal peptidase I